MYEFHTSIRQKIIFGYILGVAALIGLSTAIIVDLWYIEKRVQLEATVTELFDETLEMRRFEKNFFLYNQNEDYKENLRYSTEALETIGKNRDAFNTLGVSPQVATAEKSLAEYQKLAVGFAQEKDISGRTFLEKKIRDKGKEIIETTEFISNSVRQKLQKALNKTQKIIIFSLFFFSVIGLAVGLILSRAVVRPLKSLEDKMDQIAHGRLQSIVLRSRDREIVSFTRAFNKMLKELELRRKRLVQTEKLASLGTLLSGVAHELNNPLSNISSSCQILTEELA
ncbi:MAG: HAMP domain-containing protein, partial [Nitrospirota bacterium]